MYIQIDNTSFDNKGSTLMLESVIERLSSVQHINPQLVAGKIWPLDFKQIRNKGLLQLFSFRKYKFSLQNSIPKAYLDLYGLVVSKNVNILLDIGGFQFSDQFSESYSHESNRELEKYYNQLKKNGVKIIFLPQAFGPFDETLSKERIKIVDRYSNIIYAREEKSYNHLLEIIEDKSKLRVSPDFTCLLEADLPYKLYQRVNGGICLIPNYKMIEKTDSGTAEKYIDFFVAIAKFLLEKNYKVILLNHAQEEDWKIIQLIATKLQDFSQVVLLNNLNTLEAKAVIKHSQLLISSRYHGVISGLSQGIPTFCTSWSHKYEELMKEYKLSNNILSPNEKDLALQKIEFALKVPHEFTASQQEIELVRIKSEKMWQEVIRFIE